MTEWDDKLNYLKNEIKTSRMFASQCTAKPVYNGSALSAWPFCITWPTRMFKLNYTYAHKIALLVLNCFPERSSRSSFIVLLIVKCYCETNILNSAAIHSASIIVIIVFSVFL